MMTKANAVAKEVESGGKEAGAAAKVDLILSGVDYDPAKVQALLCHATLPELVRKVAARLLKPRETVDLVGGEIKMKLASNSVKHLLLLPRHNSTRTQLVQDVISCYGSGGRIIVFTETKNDASELAGALKSGTAWALHGDISQIHREVILQGFQSGKFSVLVATDVAARGLDIDDVQLVVQCEPPRNADTYIQRSRNTGISVMFFDKKKEYMIPHIERKVGFKFERIAPPQPGDGILAVDDNLVPLFRHGAQDLVESSGLPTLDVLSKATAKFSGQTDLKRSLPTSHDDFTTLMLKANTTMYSTNCAFNCLRKYLPVETLNEVRRMNLTLDGTGAVFDVPSRSVEQFTAEQEGEIFTVEILDALPQLQVKPERSSFLVLENLPIKRIQTPD